jgi:hypothetical protein
VEPIAFTPLGYAANELGLKSRKAFTEIIKYEHW